MGAPLGWLCIQFVSGVDPLQDIINNLLLYSYMAVGTLIAFSSFGWFLGLKEERLRLLSIKDALTGAFNRRYFQSRLDTEIQITKRSGGALSMILFDVDHFKKLNDEFGHTFGDLVLVDLVKVVSHVVRNYETLCRVGGEEFAILLPNCELSVAKDLAERIRETVENHEFGDNSKLPSVTISLGVKSTNGEIKSSFFYSEADTLLYAAKKAGRNCVVSQ